MERLRCARDEINRIDLEMAKLFCARMKAAELVAEYKAENGLEIEDKTREAELLRRNLQCVPDMYRLYYERFFFEVLRQSKDHQRAVTDKIRPGGAVNLTVPLGDDSYGIRIVRGALKRAGDILKFPRKALILTDDGVPVEYADTVASFCADPHIMRIPAGEASKCREVYFDILSRLTEYGFDRHGCLIAVGGGVVGDIGGFAAATYMRGLDFYNIPTTLLAMTDSSAGGKTAINFMGNKNSVGAFYQPKGVLIDPELLKTLPERQVSCGMAEIIKMFATCDANSFSRLENGDFESIEELIAAALRIKIGIVSRDERECELRMVLNFGHTVGHAIESADVEGSVKLLHGECVGLGMLVMSEPDVRERIKTLLARYGLPTDCTGSAEKIKAALAHDKKSENGRITAVAVKEIGDFSLVPMSLDEVLEKTKEVLSVS